MNSLKQTLGAALLAALTICAQGVNAQTAGASSPASCTQNGQVVTCTTTTTFNVPSGVNLQSQSGGGTFSLASGAPVIVAPAGCFVAPSTVLALVGAAPTLAVTCPVGSGNYTYQWTKGGTNIAGATNPTYSLSPNTDTSTANVSSYSVLVVNTGGSNYATPGTVTVSSQSAIAPSACSVTPASANLSVGGSQTLAVTCGTGTAPFNYVWYKGNAQIANATSSTYTLTSADTTSAGAQTYRVDVSNSGGTASASGNVTVAPVSTCSNSTSVNATIDANSGYKQVGSSNLFGTANTYTVKVDVNASSSTVGGWAVLLSHTEGIASQRAFRTVSISPCAGDFTSPVATVLAGGAIGGSFELALNEPGRGIPNLTTGVWYINVKNTQCTANTRCDVLIDWLHY